MDFQQAQAGFQRLEAQLKTEAISLQQYQAGLNELRVTDPWGRLWMMQERTGIWHVFNNGAWVAAQPPVQPTVPPPPTPVNYAAPVIPAAQGVSPIGGMSPAGGIVEAGGAAKKEPSLFAKYMRGILIVLVIWIVIAAAVYLFWGRDHLGQFSELLVGIAVAAVLSLVLTLGSFRGHWKGQVVDVKVVSEQTQDDIYEDVRYAYIRQVNGKMRRERAMPNWQVGDWLEKKQGENWVRKL